MSSVIIYYIDGTHFQYYWCSVVQCSASARFPFLFVESKYSHIVFFGKMQFSHMNTYTWFCYTQHQIYNQTALSTKIRTKPVCTMYQNNNNLYLTFKTYNVSHVYYSRDDPSSFPILPSTRIPQVPPNQQIGKFPETKAT